MQTARDETVRLQAQVRDLAALLALPAMWRGREVPFIISSLLDALVSLLRVDSAYLRLESTHPTDVVEDWLPRNPNRHPDLESLLEPIRDDDTRSVFTFDIPGRAPVRVSRLFPRIQNGRALVVLCSSRPDFPTDIESFLFKTAVDQGIVAIEAARLLRDVKEANRAKAAFLATMSHELRTPLNAILGYVDLLDAEVAGTLNDVQKQSLRRVRAGSLHLMELIEGILNFARIDAGKEQVHAAETDICELTEETAQLVEPLANAKALRFVVRTPNHPVHVWTDASKVRQILLNLLSNAVKFTQHGQIELELSEQNGGIAFAVRDTGHGIALAECENIFEPFRQVGDVYTEKSTGTGLGLSVSRQLARLLGGDITVNSEVGKGSEFKATLPAVEARIDGK